MGLGFAIIGNSRPYEGLFFGIPVAVALLAWLWKLWKTERSSLAKALKRAVAPLLAVLALTLVSMGYYNWRTTGSPFDTPYLAYEDTYNPVPLFPWQPLRPIPAFRHSFLQKGYLKFFALPQYRQAQSVKGFAAMELTDFALFWTFYLSPLFTLPLVFAFVTLPYGFSWKNISPGTRFLLLVCGVTLAGEALPTAYSPHYSAPIACVIIALVVIAMRRVRPWRWRGKPAGEFATRAVPSICVLLFILVAGATIIQWPAIPRWPGKGMLTWCALTPSNTERAAMLAQLERYPGRQLVIVRQNDIHDKALPEWVCNQADLNSARVIWADDMGPAKDEELINYFKYRHAWLLDAGDYPPKLLPYPRPSNQ